MTAKPKVSVLIPIFNVEKYLRLCLDSVVNQTLKDIEIICIDDGSTDSSPEIIASYAKKDKRVKVITKKNSGYGDSMNKGLEAATGKYIGIVESDDTATLDMFETLYDLAEKNGVNFVKSSFYFYWSQRQPQDVPLDMFNHAYAESAIEPINHPELFRLLPCIWSAIYNREFLNKNKIRFLPSPGASYQDTGFSFKVWSMLDKAYVTNQPFLHYRQDNENSSVKSPGKVFCVAEEYESIEKYLKDNKRFEALKGIMQWCKFNTYYWNVNRLTSAKAKDFLVKMSEEFREADEKKYIDWSMFDAYETGLLKKIIKNPKTFLISRVPSRAINKTKETLNKILMKVSWGYKQKKRIIELEQELADKVRILEQKIERLNKNIGSK